MGHFSSWASLPTRFCGQGCLLQGADSLKMNLAARDKQWGRRAGQIGQTVEAAPSRKSLQNTSIQLSWPQIRILILILAFPALQNRKESLLPTRPPSPTSRCLPIIQSCFDPVEGRQSSDGAIASQKPPLWTLLHWEPSSNTGFNYPANRGPLARLLSPVPPCHLTSSPTYGLEDKEQGWDLALCCSESSIFPLWHYFWKPAISEVKKIWLCNSVQRIIINAPGDVPRIYLESEGELTKRMIDSHAFEFSCNNPKQFT